MVHDLQCHDLAAQRREIPLDIDKCIVVAGRDMFPNTVLPPETLRTVFSRPTRLGLQIAAMSHQSGTLKHWYSRPVSESWCVP